MSLGWIVALSLLGALAAAGGGLFAALPWLVAPPPGPAAGGGAGGEAPSEAGGGPAAHAEAGGGSDLDAPLGRILAALGRPRGERAVITLSEAEVNGLAALGLGLLAAQRRFGTWRVELRLEPGEVEGRVVMELPRRLPFAPLRGRPVGCAFRLGVGARGQWLEVRPRRVAVGRVPLPVRFGLWVAGQVRLPPILAVDARGGALLVRLSGLRLPGLRRSLGLEDVLVSYGSLTLTLGPEARG